MSSEYCIPSKRCQCRARTQAQANTLTSSGGPPGLWGKENIKVPEFRERPSSRPLKTQQRSHRGRMRLPAAQNPFF